jgi:hypothetical protein
MADEPPADPVDQASHGSGKRNADHGTPSSQQILRRPGQPDPLAPVDRRPAEGRRTDKDRSPEDVSE